MVVHQRQIDGAETVERVGGVDVSAALDEQPHDLEMALVRGKHQRRGVVACLGIDGDTGIEDLRDPRPVAGARGVEQRVGGCPGLYNQEKKQEFSHVRLRNRRLRVFQSHPARQSR